MAIIRVIAYNNRDEYCDGILYALDDKADAEAHIARLTGKNKTIIKYLRRACDFWHQWVIDNPRPTIESSEFKLAPRWPSGMRQQDITKEMRDERQEVSDYNQKLIDDMKPLDEKWDADSNAAMIKWIEENPLVSGYLKPEEATDVYHKMSHFNFNQDEITYHIETLELMS